MEQQQQQVHDTRLAVRQVLGEQTVDVPTSTQPQHQGQSGSATLLSVQPQSAAKSSLMLLQTLFNRNKIVC